MKALTVQQPWAWAIVHGGKDVENRSRNVAGSYRGPLPIHTSLTRAVPALADWRIEHAMGRCDQRDLWTVGAIIGVVDLVDVHKVTGDEWVTTCCESPWGDPRPAGVHLVLEHPRPLRRPIPARGRLGLWDLDGEQLAQLIGTGAISGMECA